MGLKPRVTPEVLERAVRYGRLPWIRNADVCARYKITERQLRAARKTLRVYLSRRDLVLAALSGQGEQTSGTVGDLDSIAGFVDWQNHDGCRAEEVQAILDSLVADGVLAIEGDRWRLLVEWP